MRLSVILLACSAAGILGGGALTGMLGLGLCLIFVSLCAGGWALFHDDGIRPQIHTVPTLPEILERARAS